MAVLKACILLGAPGSGKGTQAKKLQERFNIPHISTGDILRKEIEAGSELGKRVQQIMASGKLVGDDLIVEIVRNRFSKQDVQSGFVLDGFPRTIHQADSLSDILKEAKLPLPKVLQLDVPDQVLIDRLTGRMSCAQCGTVYHRRLNPPRKAGICNECGSTKFVERKDDSEETVRKRLNVYKAETEPLVDYYRSRGLLEALDANLEMDLITNAIVGCLEK